MDHRNLDIDKKMLLAAALESLMRARQAAYQAALSIPEMKPTFEAAEATYANLAETFKANYVPVFDEAAYVEEQLARGDKYHTFAHDKPVRAPKP